MLYSYKFKILVYLHEKLHFPKCLQYFCTLTYFLFDINFVRLTYIDDQMRVEYEPHMAELHKYFTT